MHTIRFLALILFACNLSAAETLRLPNIFGPKMVLQQGKPAYLASSTEGAPPAPPALVNAGSKGDEKKVTKVLKKITTGGSSKKGKGRKKKSSKGGTPCDFNACVVEYVGFFYVCLQNGVR